MNPNEITAILTALEPVLGTLASVGLPGLFAIVLSGPALLITVVLIQSHTSTRRMERAQEHFQGMMLEMVETYRKDTQSMLGEVAEKHAEVVNFYHKNVELVKNYERMTDFMQTLVVNNTRALERLTTIIESRKTL